MGPEATIERTICKEARAAGWLERKLKFLSIRGAPDRIFGRAGVTVLIEFKPRDGHARRQQLKRHRELREEFGLRVEMCHSVHEGRAILDLPKEKEI